MDANQIAREPANFSAHRMNLFQYPCKGRGFHQHFIQPRKYVNVLGDFSKADLAPSEDRARGWILCQYFGKKAFCGIRAIRNSLAAPKMGWWSPTQIKAWAMKGTQLLEAMAALFRLRKPLALEQAL
jgi:hypothetical protein